MAVKYYEPEELEALGIKRSPQRVKELVERAFDETGAGVAGTKKLRTQPDKNTAQFTHHPFNPRVAGVKDVGDGLNNAKEGLDRFDVTFTVKDRRTMQKHLLLNGAPNSEDRTGVLPVIGVDCLAPRDLDLEVFVFGARTYADVSVKFQLALLSHRIKRVSIKGEGTVNSTILAKKYQSEAGFPVEAVDNLDNLATANVVIYATTEVWEPLHTSQQLKQSGFLLLVHLSEGTEIPHDYIQAALDNDANVCDVSLEVWHRNGQCLPRYLREEKGMKTEEEFLKLGVKDIYQMKDLTEEQRDKRWLLTGVGVATTDLALAEDDWEQLKALDNK